MFNVFYNFSKDGSKMENKSEENEKNRRIIYDAVPENTIIDSGNKDDSNTISNSNSLQR